MRKLSLEKRPYSIDKYIWNIYKRYCNAVEKGEEKRAEDAQRTLWLYGYSIKENCHGQAILVDKDRQ